MISFSLANSTCLEYFKNACQLEITSVLASYLYQDKAISALALGKEVFYREVLMTVLPSPSASNLEQAHRYDLLSCLLEIPLIQKMIRENRVPNFNEHFSSMLFHGKDTLVEKLLDLEGFGSLSPHQIFILFLNNHFGCLEKVLSHALYHPGIAACFEINETADFSLLYSFAKLNRQTLILRLIDILKAFPIKIDIVVALLCALPQEEKFIQDCIVSKNLMISLQALGYLFLENAPFSLAFIHFCLDAYQKRRFRAKEEAFFIVERHLSLGRDSLEILPKLIDLFPECLHQTNAQGENALLIALLYQKYEMAYFLLSKNFHALDIISKAGFSPRLLILDLQKAYDFISQSKQPQTVGRWDFEKWVSNLLTFFQLKDFEMMFRKQRPSAINYISFFLANPIVQQYLTRSLFSINGKGELVNLSWYEREFYESAQKNGLKIPYRSDDFLENKEEKEKKGCLGNFLLMGTVDDTILFIYEVVRAKVNACKVPYIQFHMTADLNEYCLALSQCARSPQTSYDEYGNSFVICFYIEQYHAQCLLSVFNQHYVNQFRHTFIDSSALCLPDALEGLNQAINLSTSAQGDFHIFDAIGFELQYSPADANCVLYTKDIAQSLYSLLRENVHLRQALGSSYFTSTEYYRVLTSEFCKRLPQYFTATPEGYLRKNWNQLLSYFAKARWQLGSLFLKKQMEEAKNKMNAVVKIFECVAQNETPLLLATPVFLPQKQLRDSQQKPLLEEPSTNKKLKASALSL